VAAGFLLPILVFPGLITLLPAALLAMAAAALVSGRLSLTQATLAGVALLSAFMAHHDLHFTLFSLPSAPFGRELQLLHYPEIRMALLALAAVALSVFLPAGRLTAWLIRPATVLCVAALLTQVYERTGSAEDGGDRWVQAQLWARQHTPVGAVFLTPSAPGGFRIHSERGVVGEWRDGTQQYFDPAFASLWWQRMEALQPGVRYDASGTRQVSEGQPLTDLSDDALEAICRQFGASYLVLPAASSRDFVPCYRNRDWRIYRAERAAPLPPPPDAVNPEVWLQQQAFLEDTVRPNIRRFRTSDVRIQVVNAGGLPLRDRPFAVQQTDSLFRFGSALGYFIRPPVTTNRGDGSAYTVIPKELEYFPQIFNFSVTGYSGKWAAMEPEQGRVTYEDLDQYVDWCRQHQVRIQFHFVTGYEPRWLKALPPEEQEVCLTRRTGELLARYGDRIETWQVINEKHLLKLSPSAFKLMHKTSPDLPLGISDCALFWSAKPPPAREKEMTRGMLDQLAWLREQGARVDFVGLHGHRPFQLWADLRDLYKLFDLFAREGVRIYVTEFGVETGSSIVGPVRSGTWTDELQAEYYALVFETCFSHPAVDGINFWGIGPHTFVKRAGLLDENYEPKPAFHTLRRLIRETWRTGVSGTLGLDGGIAFRGYHGDYTLTLSRRDGQQTNLAFRVQPGSNAVFRFTVPDE
jgi:GH35 family endo-1,4-beta-xylanase